MIVTTTAPRPGATSCARAWLAPASPTTATNAAIQRVMTDLLCVSNLRYCRASARGRTIGQKRDRRVTLVCETSPCRADERRLVLLDDAGLGHAGGVEIRSIAPKLTDNL